MTAAAQPDRYRIPGGRHRVEEEIKRSRFITTLAHTPTVEDARVFVAEVSVEFADASHNCWAYVIGPPGSTGQVGISDAGEPHGTAGRPMLTVLLHSGVGDICAVVTRYFGGTLLGKGGLVRAYGGGVQLALAGAPTLERVAKVRLDVILDYAAITLFKRMLPNYEAELIQEKYAADAEYQMQLPAARLDEFCAALYSLTNGQALIDVVARDD